MDRDAIKAIIPHREPFLLVDEVLELEPGKRVLARLTLTGKEYFFAGHFPGTPVMPGVLTVEAMAQAGAIAVLSMEEYKGKIAYFAGIDKARFRRKITPGDSLEISVTIVKMRSGIGIGSGLVTVSTHKAATAEITFAIA